MNRLTGQRYRIDELTERDRKQMFGLMQKYYEYVDRDAFERDLSAKDWAIVARCRKTAEIYGFSTQQFSFSPVGGKSIGILFSGDTIVDKQYWGRNPLATLWGQLALSLIEEHPDHTLVWFLISKGYKTYRYLPVFFREFYPHPDQPTPPWAQTIREAIASARFGQQYNPTRGVIVAGDGSSCLKPAIADVTSQRLHNRFVKFFDVVNPGHARGDELCCLAPLTRENLNAAAYRVIDASVV